LTILVLAQAGILGMGSVSPVELSYLADNILLFRFFETHGHVRKALSVVKKRSGTHENTIRELNLSGGISVGEPLSDFRGVLSTIPTYTGKNNSAGKNAGRK
jgi:circadian clock protein KaiC